MPFCLLPLSFAAATRRSWEAASQLAQIARGHRGVAAVALFEAHNLYHRGGAQKTIHFNGRLAHRFVNYENNLGEISSGKKLTRCRFSIKQIESGVKLWDATDDEYPIPRKGIHCKKGTCIWPA